MTSVQGKIINKLSTRTVIGGRPDAPPKDHKGPKWLWRCIGVASGFKTGTTDKGDWAALLGMFQGINIETGEAFRSGTCFLPNVALDLILGQLRGDKDKSVSFGFNIGVQRDESSATGYVYVADPVAEVMEADPLRPLLEKMERATSQGKAAK